MTETVVQFTNRSVSDVPIDTYLWDFDDGDTDNTASPEHTFTERGVFDVALTVTNTLNLEDTVIHRLSLLGSMWMAGLSYDTYYAPSGEGFSLYYDEGWGIGVGIPQGVNISDSSEYPSISSGVSNPSDRSDKYIITYKGVYQTNPYRHTSILLADFYTLFLRAALNGGSGSNVRMERLRIYTSPQREGWIFITGGQAQHAYTDDYGLTWTPSFIYSASTDYDATGHLAISYWNSGESGRIYSFFHQETTLYQSDDWGKTWGIVSNYIGNSNPLTKGFKNGLTIPKLRDNGVPNINSTDQIIYVLIDVLAGDPDHWLYRSDDAGVTFQQVAQLPSGTINSNLVINPDDSQLMYIMANSQLYWSDDAGLNWTLASDNVTTFISDLVVSPDDPDFLICWGHRENFSLLTTSHRNIYYTEDRGETWIDVTPNESDATVFGIEET